MLPGRHLVVCEGTKTEPNYFESIRERINSRYRGEWLTIEGAGKNTTSLYEHATGIIEESPEEYSHVWLVYDKDGFPSRNFNETAQRCEGTRSSSPQFHALWTNESFELWYILHFEYLQSALSREDYASKITSHLRDMGHGPYAKNDPHMFELVWPFVDTTIRNAERLEEQNRGQTPSQSNPCTTMHHFIKLLRPYLLVPVSVCGSACFVIITMLPTKDVGALGAGRRARCVMSRFRYPMRSCTTEGSAWLRRRISPGA